MVGWMGDGWKKGRMDGWADGRTGGQIDGMGWVDEMDGMEWMAR